MKKWLDIVKDAFKQFSEDKVPRLGAALAFFTMFSLAPLLIIVIAMLGLFFGREAASGQLLGQIRGMVGAEAAAEIQTMIANTNKQSSNIIATIVGVVTLLIGATGVFGQLKDALNTIWEVSPKPGGGIMKMVRERFLSFSMVLAIGFMLLVALVVSAGLSAIGDWMGTAVVWRILNAILSFAVISALFAVLLKYLPDAEIAWKDVAVGAAITAGLFVVGKFALGLYLGRGAVSSTYGAAGSLVIILLWVYYSAQIFFGAEVTQVYANRYGSRVRPDEDAVPVTEEARANEGMPNEERRRHGAPAPGSRSVPEAGFVPPAPAPNRAMAQPMPEAGAGPPVVSAVIGVAVLMALGRAVLQRWK